MYNRSAFVDQYKAQDISIGTLYLFCFIFGVPSNVLTLLFFLQRRKENRSLTNTLCVLTALQDTITSLLSLNHGMTFLRSRDVWLPRLCPVHHIVFQMSQRMSVFLVGALSGTRIYILLYPLRRVRSTMVLYSLAVVWVLMTCFFVVPPSLGLAQITYHWNDGYCWAEAIPGKDISYTWDKLDQTMDAIGLACPIIPITICCTFTVYKIKTVENKSHGLTKRGTRNKALDRKPGKELTMAVILVTILYITSNIPLFVNYILYLITIVRFTYPGPIYSNIGMYYYSWNLTALLSTGLNASANPVVYWILFEKFRQWIKGTFIREVFSSQTPETWTISRANLHVKRKSVASL